MGWNFKGGLTRKSIMGKQLLLLAETIAMCGRPEAENKNFRPSRTEIQLDLSGK